MVEGKIIKMFFKYKIIKYHNKYKIKKRNLLFFYSDAENIHGCPLIYMSKRSAKEKVKELKKWDKIT